MNTHEKPRIARLTQIVMLLQSKKIITARELAEKFDLSMRTIYRDIKTIENSGVPVITIEGKGYAIMQGFNLPPVMFTEHEANALITAEQLVLRNKDKSFVDFYQSATSKIKSVLRHSQKEKTELLSQRIAINNNFERQTTSEFLMNIQLAITNFKLIEIAYHSLQDVLTKRIVEPFALYSTHENWLLIAFCRLRNEFRVFRLDRIQKLITQNKNFEPHDLTLQEYFDMYK
jgi:predicted DNA-binding transcriptional regulator YafY